MSTRLKLSPAAVLNADEIVEIETFSNTVLVIANNSSTYEGDVQSAFQIQAGTGKGAGDYTVGAISYYSAF
jgi:hypothetical protein